MDQDEGDARTARKLASMFLRINVEQRNDSSEMLKQISRILSNVRNGDEVRQYLRQALERWMKTCNALQEEDDIWKTMSTLLMNQKYLQHEFYWVPAFLERRLVIGFAEYIFPNRSRTASEKILCLACLARHLPRLRGISAYQDCEEIGRCTAKLLGLFESLNAIKDETMDDPYEYGGIFQDAVVFLANTIDTSTSIFDIQEMKPFRESSFTWAFVEVCYAFYDLAQNRESSLYQNHQWQIAQNWKSEGHLDACRALVRMVGSNASRTTLRERKWTTQSVPGLHSAIQQAVETTLYKSSSISNSAQASPIESSMSEKSIPSNSASILSLPDELLLQILTYVVNMDVSSNAVTYEHHFKWAKMGSRCEKLRIPSVFAVQKHFTTLVKDICSKREVVISSEHWQDDRDNKVVAQESYALLQYAGNVRFDMQNLPQTMQHPIISQLVNILRTNPVLNLVNIDYQLTHSCFPAGLSHDLREMCFNELFEPITSHCKQHGISTIGQRSGDLTTPFYREIRRQRPLHWAIKRGAKKVALCLLKDEETELDEAYIDVTPLQIAAASGYEEIVDALLKTSKVNIDALDHFGQSPIAKAAWLGHHAVVERFLKCGSINTEIRDARGRTALSLASHKGHKEIVEMMRHVRSVNVNTMDNFGQTPLFISSTKNHQSTVETLLEFDMLDPNLKDCSGRSPLSIAAAKGYEGVVRLLCLAKKDVDINTMDSSGRTPLMLAVEARHIAIVKYLLESRNVKPDLQQQTGDSALHLASKIGSLSIVELLLLSDDVRVDLRGWNGRTSLMWASMSGHEAVVKRLLKEEAIEVNSRDETHDSALTLAVQYGHTGVEKVLVGVENIDRRDVSSYIEDLGLNDTIRSKSNSD